MRKADFRKNDIKIFVSIIKHNEKVIKNLYKQLFSQARSVVSLADFQKAIEAQDIVKLVDIFNRTAGFDIFQNNLQRLYETSGIAFGTLQSKLLKQMLKKNLDIKDFTLKTITADHAIKLTKGLKEDATKIILNKVQKLRKENVIVSDIAKDIKDHIPLSLRQSTALDRFKEIVKEKGKAAQIVLESESSTKNQIKRAKKDVRILGNVDRLVTKKTSTMVTQRATMIARTEAGSFLNTLQFEQYRALQKDDKGRVYKKEWVSIGDSRTRESHIYLTNKYSKGNGIPLDTPFQTEYGSLMYPQASNGPPQDVIDCRCKMVLAW